MVGEGAEFGRRLGSWVCVEGKGSLGPQEKGGRIGASGVWLFWCSLGCIASPLNHL